MLAAALGGHEAIVKILIKQGANENDRKMLGKFSISFSKKKLCRDNYFLFNKNMCTKKIKVS